MKTSGPFIPGLELSRIFYEEAVRPILDRRFRGLTHGAGRLHTGSDVLGFDTPRSMDHDWGPKTTLFLAEADCTGPLVDEILRVLGEELPFEVRGYSTHIARPEVDGGAMAHATRRPITHGVNVTTAPRFFRRYLRVDPLADEGLRAEEWLAIPEQHLRTVTRGGVFHDGTGELTRARERLRWYPRDVWLYLLAAQWRRIEQEEPFMGRCGEVGDEVGSRLVAARLVREVMHLCFLMEREYAPYTKWFGTAFSHLACAPRLMPLFEAALGAATWQERERHLSDAYEAVAEMHNRLGITAPIEPRVSPFHGRPFLVIHGDRFWTAIRATIVDEAVKRLPPHLGSITQWVDSTDVLSYPHWFAPLRQLYRHAAT
jgi:Domain of unknown function (DUF4037)